MDTRPFRYVLTIAELGSVSRAAERLFIAQPSLSQYLRKVEHDVGEPLFDRSTTPLRLTTAGELYVAYARDVLARDQAFTDDLARASAGEIGHLRIGMSRSRATHLLPLVLPRFTARHPGIEVSTTEAGGAELRSAVLAGELDLALVALLEEDPALSFLPITTEELVLVGEAEAVEAAFGDADHADWDTLGTLPLLCLPRGRSARAVVQALFTAHELLLSPVRETTSNEAAVRLASSGLGWTIVPASTLSEVRPVSPVRTVSLGEGGVRWRFGAIHRPHHPPTRVMRDWIDVVGEVMSAAS